MGRLAELKSRVNQEFPVYAWIRLKLIRASVKRMPKKSSERFSKRLPAAISMRSTIQSDNRYKKAATSVK